MGQGLRYNGGSRILISFAKASARSSPLIWSALKASLIRDGEVLDLLLWARRHDSKAE